MAGRIKGITVEIDGDTKGLDKSLKGITSESDKVGKELKDIEKLLKFNPGNTELVAQKQKLLGEQVELTSKKLDGLKGAQEQVEDQFKKGEIGEEQYRAFKREIEATEGVLNGYKGQLSNVQSEQDRLNQNTSRLDTMFKATGSSVEDYQDVLGSKLTNAIKNGTASADDMEVALIKIGKSALGSEVDVKVMKETLDKVDDGQAIENVKSELDGISTKANEGSTSLEELGNTVKSGALLEAGEKLAEVGQKVKEFAADAQDAFREVDDGLDIIVTKTGATTEAMEGFEEIYNSLVSSLPVDDFTVVGSAIGELNTQFGFTGDELEKTSDQMIKFAEINGTDVTNSSINAKRAIEAYKLENGDLAMVLDSVTQVAQDTGQSVDKLFDVTVKGAPQLRELGLTFADSAQLIGQFEKNGIDSTKALSYMSKASVVFAKDNVSLVDGLGDLQSEIKNASSETEALAIASEVFGTKGASVMSDAIRRGALEINDLGGVAENSMGKVSQTFEDTLDPIDQQQVAMNNITLVMSEFGGMIAEGVIPLLDIFIPIIKGLSDVFSALPGPVKTIIVVIGGILVGISALLPVILALNMGLAATGLSMGGLMATMLPIIAIVLAVIAVVTAIILIFKNWGAITDWFSEKLESFGKWTSKIFSGIGDSISGTVDGFKEAFNKGMKWIEDLISGTVKNIIKFFDFKWELPKIKMPRFSLEGKFSLKEMSVPKLKVDWFAKGGILTKPTIFGSNGGNLMGGGEAGPEAIAPISDLMSYVRAAVSETIGNMPSRDEIHVHLQAFGDLPRETLERMVDEIVYLIEDKRQQNEAFGGG